MEKKTIFSLVKPTGRFTIGNYIGAVKNWNEMQEGYNAIFGVADLHALTVEIEPESLRENTYAMLASFIACGIDPKKSVVYCQSHIKQHAELCWLLNGITYFGEASRMTQFKNKKQKNDNISVGLFNYPVLMAADILLYDSAYVPIGEDQRQHLELARTLAARFNSRYGETFVVPEGYYPKLGAKIYDLQNPEKKMSKSDEDASGVILLEDEPDAILAKVKRAVTDSDNRVIFSKDKPGISNLLTIYCTLTGKTAKQAEAHFEGKGYGVFKKEVGEAVVEFLRKPQETFKYLMKDKKELDKVAAEGAGKLSARAEEKIKAVKAKVGLLNA